MNFLLTNSSQHAADLAWPAWRKRLPLLISIVGLHAALFYSVQHGLWQQAAQVVLPRVLITTMLPASIPQPQAPNPPQLPAPRHVPVSWAPVEIPDLPRLDRPVLPSAFNPQVETTAAVAPVNPATPAIAVASVNLAPPAPAIATPQIQSSAVHYVQAPQPAYPSISRRLGEQGKVMLKVLINDQGQPEQVEVSKSSGYERLDHAARNAVLKALFSPYRENGRAITVLAMVPIVFELDA